MSSEKELTLTLLIILKDNLSHHPSPPLKNNYLTFQITFKKFVHIIFCFMRFPSQQLATSEMEKWEKKSKGMISLALSLTSDDIGGSQNRKQKIK